jgi:DNA primase large subunit
MYAYGMRNRAAKRNIQKVVTGATTALFASPTEIAKRGGRREMTIAEFIAYRVHGHREAWIARELLNGQRRYRRRPVRVA